MHKKLWMAICALGMLLCWSIIAQQVTEPSSTGRYQLLSGAYQFDTDKASATSPGIFKIDTTTGKTWKYYTAVRSGKLISAWMEIQD